MGWGGQALDLTDSAGLRRKLKQFKSADPIDIATSQASPKVDMFLLNPSTFDGSPHEEVARKS